MFSPIHFVTTTGNCAFSARIMLFAVCTHAAPRHGTAWYTPTYWVHFSTKKGSRVIVLLRMGPKMHSKWNQIAWQMTIIIEWSK